MDPRIENFDIHKCSWQRYAQQLLLYLEAYKVEDKLRVPTTLTVIGSKTYNLLCDLIAPEDPKNKSLDEIFVILGRHFTPVGLSRMERFKFRERKQGESESISSYAAELRKISVNCEFAEKLNFMLVEQFIYGLKDLSTKKRLILEKNDISFEEIIAIACAAELSSKNLSCLENTNNKNDLFFIKKKTEITKPNWNNKTLALHRKCKHCGSNHAEKFCKYKDAVCHYCSGSGHIKPVCKFLKGKDKNKTNSIELAEEDDSHLFPNKDINLSVNKCKEDFIINTYEAVNAVSDSRPIVLNIIVNSKEINFQLDTGAAISLIPMSLCKALWPSVHLEPTKVILKAFDHLIKPAGVMKVNVKYRNNTADNLELFVTHVGSTPLLGRAWFAALGLKSNLGNEIFSIENSSVELNKLLAHFDKLFSDELGCIKDVEAHLFLKKNSQTKFCKHRNVPYAIIPAVEKELSKLQSQGIITPVKFSRWAAPIVPILKKNGSLRICGDYRIGLNKNLEIDHYPLPVIDDILSKLNGGEIFSKLDMAQAYHQIRMESKSSELLTINTHLGLFGVNRLPFGISPAPAIFQSIMDTILKTVKKEIKVVCYLDDILISSKNLHSHLDDLKVVLEILEYNGIRLNKDKCEFCKSSVEYLGHIVSKKGISVNSNKIKAVIDAPTPTNVDQLRSFLGLLSYYRKFIPNLSHKISELNQLLCKGNKWLWNENCDKQFQIIKEEITSEKLLTHYDPNLELILATDASPYGLGAILSHRFSDKSEKPIMFASRSLNTTEKRYSQLDREALGIIFGIKKFHKYIYGRVFTLVTDHKPLTYIFSPEKEIPTLAASRLQHWAIILSNYNYNITYKPSKENCNTDALSRLPLSNFFLTKEEDLKNIYCMEAEDEFPFTKEDIAIATQQDQQLRKIMEYLRHGWPKIPSNDPIDKNFFTKKDQLSIEDGCIIWGLRVVIPAFLKEAVLKELHHGHYGIVKMKLLARSTCWWFNVDKDIEFIAKTCRICQLNQKDPAKVTVHPWTRPKGPWIRIHTDIMGPYLGKLFLVTVDSYSKWPEIKILEKANSEKIMITLEDYFSRYGYPELIVSDNGTPFTSDSFELFCKNRGIHHTKSAPLHPASNGQAERFVEIAKNFLKKGKDLNDRNLRVEVDKLLYTYRSTPHCTLKVSPAELFLGRKLRSRLQKINPLPILPQKSFGNKYIAGQNILTRNFSKLYKTKWIEAKIIKVLSPVTFLIELNDGRQFKRHFNQMRPSYLIPKQSQSSPSIDSSVLDHLPFRPTRPPALPATDSQPNSPKIINLPSRETTPGQIRYRHSGTQDPRRYPTRTRKPPDRLNLL